MVTLFRLRKKLYCGGKLLRQYGARILKYFNVYFGSSHRVSSRFARSEFSRFFSAILFFCGVSHVWAWNATGHRISAQIAYDNLTPHAKERFNTYNHALDKVYEPFSFINASVWLDTLRSEGINWYMPYHYIDIFYTTESLTVPVTPEINGVWAIQEAVRILENPKTIEFDKGISFRVLLHVIGDLHQPLHTISRVSVSDPEGDKGGNSVELGKNSVANNLHGYWDLGGGAFRVNRPSASAIVKRAGAIEDHYPCKRSSSNVMNWVDESHAIAINIAYKVKAGETPSEKYQKIVRKLSEQRIAQAGCRIATLLNRIDKKLSERAN